MTDTNMLEMLKIDLGISTTAYDSRLTRYIESAKEHIEIEGITLDTASIKDCSLIVMYAGWLWRKRESGEGMPRMIRYALNNRLFSEKVGE